MKRLVATLVLCLGLAQAWGATITGNVQDSIPDSVLSGIEIAFRPLSTTVSGPTITLGRTIVVYSDTAGDWTVTLKQGTYWATAGGSPLGWIHVPDSTSTFTLREVAASIVYLSTAMDYGIGITNLVLNSLTPAITISGSPAIGPGGTISIDLDESQLDLSQISGLVPVASLPTNSVSSAGIVPSGSGQTNKIYGTDAAAAPGWIEHPVGPATPGRLLKSDGTRHATDSIIEETAEDEITVHGKIQMVGDPTKVNVIGGAGTVFTNWVQLIGITKAEKTALSATNGMVLYQTDNTPGLRAYIDGTWKMLSVEADP